MWYVLCRCQEKAASIIFCAWETIRVVGVLGEEVDFVFWRGVFVEPLFVLFAFFGLLGLLRGRARAGGGFEGVGCVVVASVSCVVS